MNESFPIKIQFCRPQKSTLKEFGQTPRVAPKRLDPKKNWIPDEWGFCRIYEYFLEF